MVFFFIGCHLIVQHNILWKFARKCHQSLTETSSISFLTSSWCHLMLIREKDKKKHILLKDNKPHSFTTIDRNTSREKWHTWLLIHCSCRARVVYYEVYDKCRLSQTVCDEAEMLQYYLWSFQGFILTEGCFFLYIRILAADRSIDSMRKITITRIKCACSHSRPFSTLESKHLEHNVQVYAYRNAVA